MIDHEKLIDPEAYTKFNRSIGVDTKLLPHMDYNLGKDVLPIGIVDGRPVIAVITDGDQEFRVVDLRENGDRFAPSSREKSFFGLHCSVETQFIVLGSSFEESLKTGQPKGYKTIPYGQTIKLGKNTENGHRFKYRPFDEPAVISITHDVHNPASDSLVVRLEYGDVELITAKLPEVMADQTVEAQIDQYNLELKQILEEEVAKTFPEVDPELVEAFITQIADLRQEFKTITRKLQKQNHVDKHGNYDEKFQEISALINVLLALRRKFEQAI